MLVAADVAGPHFVAPSQPWAVETLECGGVG